MGQYLRINGDYNIKTRDGGKVVLDTGSSGDVILTGNLTVQGDVTSVATTNLEIADRIITLNQGKAGPGVSLVHAGIEIDRGTYVDSTTVPRAAFVWNETDPGFTTDEDPASASGYWQIATGSAETSYGFADSNLKVRRILTDAGTDSGDLTLIGTGTGVVKVAGTTNYRLQATDDDDIPNKDYVDYSILNNPTFQIRAPQGEDTRVIIADADITPNISTEGGSLAYYGAQSGYPTTESGVGFLVDGTEISYFYEDRVRLGDLVLSGSEISVRTDVGAGVDDDIYIRTENGGVFRTNTAIRLDNTLSTPAQTASAHHIISRATIGVGDTGLYVVYPSATIRDAEELVSKKRALLFSYIF